MLYINNHRSFFLRLKNASIEEVFYRIKQKLFILNLFAFLLFKRNRLHQYTRKAEVRSYDLPDFCFSENRDIIQYILDGYTFSAGSSRNKLLNSYINQNDLYNYKSLSKKETSDIRQIWEPARLQHITTLLFFLYKNQNDHQTNKIKKFCKKSILNWIEQNPPPFGTHYLSAMECGLRIPVFFYCLKSLKNLKDTEFLKILETIYLHGLWISKRLSLYSSLGNHTIAESIGLIFAGTIFQNNAKSKKWLQSGIDILKQELTHQILDDGGPIEQSLNYHRFVLDLYWLAVNFLERNNLYDCNKLTSRLKRAEEFLSVFQNNDTRLPMIGDYDDGFAIAPIITPARPKCFLNHKDVRVFKQTGYTVINSQSNTQIIFKHGPLGMPPLYNHGHADALSVLLSIDGKMILVDPGTYRYNCAPEWRKYFKGTRAHNTITIDGFDQAVQETGFIWSHPYKVNLLGLSGANDQILVSAVHDGYTRLKEPVWHRRDILFFDDCCFLIKDSFRGKGRHDFEINFNLHPDVGLIKQNSWWRINNEKAQIYIRLLENDDFLKIRGSTDPIHGWYSPRYGTKLKCNVMSYTKRGFPHEISFVTAICTDALIDLKKFQDKLIYFD